MKLDRAQRNQLIAWAKRALHGLDESTVFVGILGEGSKAERIEFVLQLGHAVLHDKPIIIPVPFGVEVPKKLAAVADRIVRYDPANPASLQANLTVVLTEMGANPQ
jgi:hypothetical protein